MLLAGYWPMCPIIHLERRSWGVLGEVVGSHAGLAAEGERLNR